MLNRNDVNTNEDGYNVNGGEEWKHSKIEVVCPYCGRVEIVDKANIDDILVSDTHDPDYIVFFCDDCEKYVSVVDGENLKVTGEDNKKYKLWSDSTFTYLRDEDGVDWRID